jgi:hypothetical protein
MGIDAPSLALLSAAKSLGVDFHKTMMVGRQNFHGEGVARALGDLFFIHQTGADADKHLKEYFFCERLFKLLGAFEVASLDHSNYQEATHVHDLNLPVPSEWHKQFSCVYDGGTIEHVFNCPQAFKNCMEMVRVGGHFLQVNIANNFSGHGFWQFSPELIFRVLSPENGFQIKTVMVHEVVKGGLWFVAADPQVVGERAELCNSRPTYILTIAERVSDVPIFATTPQQSHYVAEWARDKGEPARKIAQDKPAWSIRKLVPQSLKQEIKRSLPWLFPGGNWEEFGPRHYRHVSEADVMMGRNLEPTQQ